MTEFIKVAKMSDLQPGEKMEVDYDEESVALFNIDGSFYAIRNECTHEYSTLVDGELEGDEIICPLHDARFNVKTGQETAPAFEPVETFEVKIDGDDILIAPVDE
ncbi:MAG: Rieske 2Fe-2S domain-containing protein [Caldithrix sp.]|nr:Rieske 2Fe-2S domain-containing protein [Caldithrix sp.]